MICAKKRRRLIFSFGVLVALAGGLAPAWAEEATVPSTCALSRPGDCCSVTIGGDRDAEVSTAIKTEEGVDFIVMMNRGKSDCIFRYDGEMHVPMQSYVGGFIGTWLGGDFTLHYMNDAAGRGSCRMDIYYMNISNYAFPDACRNHRSRYNSTANPSP